MDSTMGTKYKGTEEARRALDAYIKLQRASETALSNTTAHLSDYNLTWTQFAVLEALYHLGTLSQSELATKLLRSAGNITPVLKNIEKKGLASRVRSAEDNRFMQVSITDKGRALIASMFDKHVAGIVWEMSALTAEEQIELARLCRKLGLEARGESTMQPI
jgi:MarR family 2-MHQ and catechol resistance regulon transcriptional repressor